MPTFTPPPPLTVPQFADEAASRPAGLSTGTIVVSLFVIALLVGLIGGVYPAYRGASLAPTEAIRHE